MLRNSPRLRYSGLTVVLSNQSRFDKVSLLTSTGGVLFNSLLNPEYNQMQADIRVMEDRSPLIEGTKCILTLGEFAMKDWIPETRNNSLNEMRGSPCYVNNIPAMASFYPQDACDIKNYEGENNILSKEYTGEDEAESENSSEDDAKQFSNTRQSNYAFWLRCDVAKCKKLLRQTNPRWDIEDQPIYKIYPSSDEVIQTLTQTKEHYFYFDIETDYEEQNLLCFSFAFWKDGDRNITILSVPILNHNYQWAYSALVFIIKALVIAIRDNILVSHNGAGFDFLVLGMKYHIPIYRVYDTMLAQHRIFPSIEKSLGHCTSYWTMQRFHKDQDSYAYVTQQHMMDKLKYCGKDVFTMFLIHQAQMKFAKTIPGLESSIALVNRSIRPYLICTLNGIRYDQEKLNAICKENDLLMEQYLRIINMLIGEVGLVECKKAIKSGKAKAFPSSNKQVCNYFHDQLGYPVVFRSKKTGFPSLGKQILYKLALKHPDNPVVLFTNLYRKVQKEYSSLRFIPFKDDAGKRIDWKTYATQ